MHRNRRHRQHGLDLPGYQPPFLISRNGAMLTQEEKDEIHARDIELSSNADKYTAPSVSEFYNPAGQLVSTTCSTTAATRLDQKSN
jgi:hypothetical protein